jgi:hypothetical protein
MSREHPHLSVVADTDALAKAAADRLLKRIKSGERPPRWPWQSPLRMNLGDRLR